MPKQTHSNLTQPTTTTAGNETVVTEEKNVTVAAPVNKFQAVVDAGIIEDPETDHRNQSTTLWAVGGTLLALSTLFVLATQFERQRRKQRARRLNETGSSGTTDPIVQFELLRRTSGASQDGAP
ncbi:hypothetical protein V1264_003068 [Littorina saxatilis]|uniref:Uncharacterized protein n=1 Tax=Littorina saxatilis TaxID=31220 RepID=A0AAN9B6L2_9CAEN